MRLLGLVAIALGSLCIGCASATPPDGPVDDDMGHGEARPPTAKTADKQPKPRSAPTDAAEASGPRQRELTARECEVLGQHYGDLVRSDAMADVDPSVSEARRREFQQKLLAAADKLSERWENGCIESLVGKVASEDALECAMHGKTVSEFDACLNGPPAPPPEKP